MIHTKAFTLIELLVVMAIIALLISVLTPVLAQARRQAQIAVVNCELYQIGLALENYATDHKNQFPPTRTSCMLAEHYFQLPEELVNGGYLPHKPQENGAMSSGMEDPFNRGHTYKYQAVGTLILNNHVIRSNGSRLWAPDGFPDTDFGNGQSYDDPTISPVRWIVYSLGPKFDGQKAVEEKYPVCKKSWYQPDRRRGILTRIRLKTGRHIGTFEGK
jgi:prepilin-type N-terminal cleavage/methylation domain-containing protein